MILNHKEAIRYLIENADSLSITLSAVCTIQYLLSDGLVSPEYSGKIRDQGVSIEGTTYIPFENPASLENQLKIICEKASVIRDPFEQCFFLIVHISYLQAFDMQHSSFKK